MVTTRNKVSGGAGGRSRRACSEATSTSSVLGLAGSQVRAAGSSHQGILCAHSKMFRLGSLNLGAIRKKEGEVFETFNGRNIYLCGVEETRCWGSLCKSQNRMLTSKDSCYKLLWTGNKEWRVGIGILAAECWVGNVFDIVRISDWIILREQAIWEKINA